MRGTGRLASQVQLSLDGCSVAEDVEMRCGKRLLFGMHIDAARMEDVLGACTEAIFTRKRVLIGVLNAAKIVKLRQDVLLRSSLLQCDLLVADGQAVVWASRLLRRPLPERVTGIDIFESLLGVANEKRLSVALLGARAEVVAELREKLLNRYPSLRVVFAEHGYFKSDESEDVAARIAASGADMLFIGMTSPNKEIFLATYGSQLNVSVLHGVGGAFDVLAGLTARAPVIWQRLGMEWAFRTLQEPRRLLGRYLSTNTRFVLLLLQEIVASSKPYCEVVDPVPGPSRSREAIRLEERRA